MAGQMDKCLLPQWRISHADNETEYPMTTSTLALDALQSPAHEASEGTTMAEERETVEWITTADAARIMDVKVRTVQSLCQRGNIHCKQWGRSWMVDKASAETYRKTEGGRPPKTDTIF